MSGDEQLAEPPLLTLEFSSFTKAAEGTVRWEVLEGS